MLSLSRSERRAAMRPRASLEFGTSADAALDLLDLLDLAWHDRHGEVSPPDQVVEDVLRLAHGDVAALVLAARLAVSDARDLRVAAAQVRQSDAPA